MIKMAVEASASVDPMSSHVRELFVSCTRPLAILNMNTPGIIETTELKPIAAKGIREWRDTGVRITPVTRHAINVPVAALSPNAVSANHLRAWTAAPTATGHGSIFRGEEKKTPKHPTAMPAAITSHQRGTALPAGPTGKETPRSARPAKSPNEIAITTSTA